MKLKKKNNFKSRLFWNHQLFLVFAISLFFGCTTDKNNLNDDGFSFSKASLSTQQTSLNNTEPLQKVPADTWNNIEDCPNDFDTLKNTPSNFSFAIAEGSPELIVIADQNGEWLCVQSIEYFEEHLNKESADLLWWKYSASLDEMAPTFMPKETSISKPDPEPSQGNSPIKPDPEPSKNDSNINSSYSSPKIKPDPEPSRDNSPIKPDPEPSKDNQVKKSSSY